MSPHIWLLLIGAIVEVFEHDRTDGSRHTEMADVGGTLHENFQSISSAAEDIDIDRINGPTSEQFIDPGEKWKDSFDLDRIEDLDRIDDPAAEGVGA